ncbi:MAG: HEAT repeat domain-containing protein [Endomicrobia bacterium]|nr:HEAT repeat domain-containing protein [Endomicrobiia bacterium]
MNCILESKIFSIRIRLIKIIRKLILAVIFFEILSFWVFADKLGNLEVAGGVYGDTNMAEILQDLGSSTAAVRYKAIKYLASSLNDNTIKILVEHLDKEQDNYLKSEIMEIVSFSGSTVALSGIKRQLNNKNSYIRQLAVMCMGRFPESYVLDDIVNIISNEKDNNVKKSAINMFSNFKSTKAVEVLDKIISDEKENKDIKLLSVNVLGKINIPASRNILSKHRNHKDTEIRREVETILKKRKIE